MDEQRRTMRRTLGAIIAAVGVVVILAGIGSGTWWRPSDELRATVPGTTSADYVVTAPGVLQLSGSATVTASAADGATVVVAFGRDVDVAGWAGSSPVTMVDGLASEHEAQTRAQDGVTLDEGASADPQAGATASSEPSSTASPGVSPSAAADDASASPAAGGVALADSDMWLDHSAGVGSVSTTWTGSDPHVLMIATAVSADGSQVSAPTLTLTWQRDVSTPWVWPGIVLGALLVVVGVLLLTGVLARRRTATSEHAESAAATGAEDEHLPEPSQEAPSGDAAVIEPSAAPAVALQPGASPEADAAENDAQVPQEAGQERFAPQPREVVGRHTASVPVVSAEPVPGDPVPSEPVSSEPVSSEPVPSEPVVPPEPAPSASAAAPQVTELSAELTGEQPLTRKRLRELRAQGLVAPDAVVSAGPATGALPVVPPRATATVPGAPAPSPGEPEAPAGVAVPQDPSPTPAPQTGGTPALPDGSAASAGAWRAAWGLPGAATPPQERGADDGDHHDDHHSDDGGAA